MNEIENILSKSVISEEFLHPETICDFYVDENRKKIWAVGLDLLVEFDRICRQNNLKYFLAYGSLLGIVRHDGFIPWDDDIDVWMPRADYEKLRRLKSEFIKPYFLQYPGEDNDYFFSFAKLRNSNTSAISVAFRYAEFNQGIFLDIFPLDNFISATIENDVMELGNLVAECSALMRRGNPNPSEDDMKKMNRFPNVRDGKLIIEEIDSILRKHEKENTDKLISNSVLVYHYSRQCFDKSLFDKIIEADFYGHKVCIPAEYDKILTIIYGDYMKFPPKEKRGDWHSTSIFNPDIPYAEMLEILRKEDKVNSH